jgi:hypothetical protein
MTVSERQASKVQRVASEKGIPSKYAKASALSK